MTIAAKGSRIYDAKLAIKAAIAAKGRDMSSVDLEGFAAQIAAIETGVNISDADAIEAEVLESKTFYATSGSRKTGTMPDNGTVSTDISAKATEVTIAAGKHSGTGIVKIAAAEQAKIIPENIKEGITILGQTGTLPADIGTGTYLVRWIDFDGTILKQQRVNSGVNATNPSDPSHQYLTFSSWNNSNLITRDTDIGALYTTTDGKTYLFITVNLVTGTSPILYINKSTTDLMTINWGNGTTSTSSAIGNINFPKTYVAGSYIITIDCAGAYTFGNGTSGTTLFVSNYSQMITSVYIGANVTIIQDYSFRQQYSLKTVSISPIITTLGMQVFNTCRNIITVILPPSVTSLGSNVFNNLYCLEYLVFSNTAITLATNLSGSCTAIKTIIIPLSITSIGYAQFSNWYLLKSIVLPSGITAIGDVAFSGCTGLFEVVILATTPPALAGTLLFSSVSLLFKCYVPDTSVTTYKTATNWNQISWCIYPLSTRP